MKKWILQLGLIAALAAAAFLLRGGDQLPATPEETIAGFFDAARDGSTSAYLRLTTGELRKSLDQLRKQQGAETFRANLQRTNDGIMGQAVRELPGAPSGTATYEIELIFTDRNEVQMFRLKQVGGGWAIASIEMARVYQPAIAYGTPVFAEPEEPAKKAESLPQPSER
jgi:hypothetical protein